MLRIATVALGLWLASELIPGIEVRNGATLVVAALLLGLAKAVVRPVAVILTLSLSIVTLGFFLLVINAGMLEPVALPLDGFSIAGLWPALFGVVSRLLRNVALTDFDSWRSVKPLSCEGSRSWARMPAGS